MNSIIKTIFLANLLLSTCLMQAALGIKPGQFEQANAQNYMSLSVRLDRNQKQMEKIEENIQNNHAAQTDVAEKLAYLHNQRDRYVGNEATLTKIKNLIGDHQKTRNELSKQAMKQQCDLHNAQQDHEALEEQFYLANVARS